MKKNFNIVSFLLIIITAVSCQKFERILSDPASSSYIRFNNGITYYDARLNVTLQRTFADFETDEAIRYYKPLGLSDFYRQIVTSGYSPAQESEILPTPLVSIFIDPKFDEAGFPVEAQIWGDFIGTQSGFTPPQPDAIGDQQRYIQSDFPGVVNTFRAPVLSGIDMARWAAIPSGMHRIVVVYRPLYAGDEPIASSANLGGDVAKRIPYFNMTRAQKSEALYNTTLKSVVIIDQEIDIQANEAYSLKLIDDRVFSVDKNGISLIINDKAPKNYKLLIRKESFKDVEGNQLKKDSLYVRFINHTNSDQILADFDVYHRIAWYTGQDAAYEEKYSQWMGISTGASRRMSPVRFSELKKICTVEGRLNGNDVPFVKIPSIPLDSMMFSDGITFMQPYHMDRFKAVSQAVQTQLGGVYGTGAQHAANFSNHEIYLVKKGESFTLTQTQNGPSIGSSTFQQVIGIYRYYPLQQTIYKQGGGFKTQNVLNTFEFVTQYKNYNEISTGTNGGVLWKAILTQDQVH